MGTQPAVHRAGRHRDQRHSVRRRVYNYTRDFPYLWEELTLPIAYRDDRHVAEQILLAAARRHMVAVGDLPAVALEKMRRTYFLRGADLEPKVYWRLTDNWLELTVRFLTGVYGARDVKDEMSRQVLAELDQAGIGLASATFEVVGVPPLRVTSEPQAAE